MDRYQALLLVSFGGPEKPEDVTAFLEHVTAGRAVPRDRVEAVAEHYYAKGGRSPVNDQCRQLLSNLEPAMTKAGLRLYWGNRNWHPFLASTVAAMRDDGITRALAFVTSAFGGYSSCRQYQEDIARAREETGARAPEIDKLRLFYNHPSWVKLWADSVNAAVARWHATAPLGTQPGAGPTIVFSAHSIPELMAATSPYAQHVSESARLVAERAGLPHWRLAWQSRSGSPAQPWLGPDVCEVLEATTETGAVLAPLGFVCDNMEIVHDLDVEAAEVAAQRGLHMTRAQTVATDPGFAAMVAALVAERQVPQVAAPEAKEPTARLALGDDGPWPDYCPAAHCPGPSHLSRVSA